MKVYFANVLCVTHQIDAYPELSESYDGLVNSECCRIGAVMGGAKDARRYEHAQEA